jgi:hypothetical protein
MVNETSNRQKLRCYLRRKVGARKKIEMRAWRDEVETKKMRKQRERK